MQFDAALKLQLMLRPLSYKVDLEQFGTRSRDTQWLFDQPGGVEQWLRQGQMNNTSDSVSRAICILGGAGTGKSTITAAIWEKYLKPARATGNNDTGVGRGTEKASLDTRPTMVAAAAIHFLKHNDQRRLDPVRIIKSIAFQLALRSVPMIWNVQPLHSPAGLRALSGHLLL